jgi:hypothetical protein
MNCSLPHLCFWSPDEWVLHTIDSEGTRKDRPERSSIIHSALHDFGTARRKRQRLLARRVPRQGAHLPAILKQMAGYSSALKPCGPGHDDDPSFSSMHGIRSSFTSSSHDQCVTITHQQFRCRSSVVVDR